MVLDSYVGFICCWIQFAKDFFFKHERYWFVVFLSWNVAADLGSRIMWYSQNELGSVPFDCILEGMVEN